MAATYTTLNDVKRVIRGSSKDRVRFSDSLTEVKVLNDKGRSNIDIIFAPNFITISTMFTGDLRLKFLFNSSTDFTVIKIDSPDHREIAIGSGDISDDYVTPDGYITVPKECWGGVIAKDDSVSITFDSHISDNDAVTYIEDAEVIIDAMLSEHGIAWEGIAGNPNGRIFVSGSVPAPVQVATTYLTAYNIYTDVFADQAREADEQKTGFSNRWKKRFESVLMSYIVAEGKTVPEVFSYPDFIDEIGVDDVGAGMGKLSSVDAEINRTPGWRDTFKE